MHSLCFEGKERDSNVDTFYVFDFGLAEAEFQQITVSCIDATFSEKFLETAFFH